MIDDLCGKRECSVLKAVTQNQEAWKQKVVKENAQMYKKVFNGNGNSKQGRLRESSICRSSQTMKLPSGKYYYYHQYKQIV